MNKHRHRRITKTLFSGCIFGFLFVILALTPVLATPYGYGTYGSCAYQVCSISVTTSGSIDLELVPDSSGVHTIEGDEVEVTTNSSEGYTLQLESASATETGLVGDDDTIAATSGTPASPVALTGNQWGYRVDGLANFGVGPTSAVENQSTTTHTFAGLSLLGNPTTIKNTASPATTGDTTTVWYGVRADTSLASGEYTNTVLYTATINP